MLLRVITQARLVPGLAGVAVATTDQPADGVIEDLCATVKVACIRGPEEDVLARYVLAAEQLGADAVVRLTGDSPLLDPAVIERVLGAFRGHAYASNGHPPSWYDGTDVEVVSRDALRRAAGAAARHEREHVTTYIWKRPWLFPAANVGLPGEDYSAIELSVDTGEDLERVRRVVQGLPRRWGWRDVLAAYWEVEIQKRSGQLFGRTSRKAERRHAYRTGALAGIFVNCVNPYSTGIEREQPLVAAWEFGREDAPRFLTTGASA